MGNARGLLRLFKYIDEVSKIYQHSNDINMKTPEKLLNIAIRLSMSLFELLDNIGILGKIKVLNVDEKKFLKRGQQFQFIALILILF